MINALARELFEQSFDDPGAVNCAASKIAGARILDAGIVGNGSIEAGLILARLCLGDRADVSVVPADASLLISHSAVFVRTDNPVEACLGAQYAGWPITTDDFFAMGSGPMRMARGRESLLQNLELAESPEQVVGVLESDNLPSDSAIELIAKECGVAKTSVNLAVAPCSSIAGSLQVVARSIETAMHKLHELNFDVRTIVSTTGHAPLPPPAKPGDTVGGIGRTNDAMLYGATVTLWVDADDDAIEAVAANVPSSSSSEHGQPFAKIFKQYEYDFYKVDPLLFSPAVVTIHSLRSGRTWTHGSIETEVLRHSFLQ